ncbi:hypothetical protein CHARACLAT_014124 [Characodon lateralis]|uniref:Uncharacterized protein n=1 Tax=Characodon lateralis TaxID=208331 RepID=A0ABU7F398_9TELE|nr:hypothetical protein [Characodon lateralis]
MKDTIRTNCSPRISLVLVIQKDVTVSDYRQIHFSLITVELLLLLQRETTEQQARVVMSQYVMWSLGQTYVRGFVSNESRIQRVKKVTGKGHRRRGRYEITYSRAW